MDARTCAAMWVIADSERDDLANTGSAATYIRPGRGATCVSTPTGTSPTLTPQFPPTLRPSLPPSASPPGQHEMHQFSPHPPPSHSATSTPAAPAPPRKSSGM
ncbi:hypothetical protein LTR53_012389 [Teratosphaeriaceae sp. CCFEE 6253]|nr:hypothetical protein LTR53_012389 [Teratosphaeriaceae sp. CCFEE 6253]